MYKSRSRKEEKKDKKYLHAKSVSWNEKCEKFIKNAEKADK